jgi:hypothetical protein
VAPARPAPKQCTGGAGAGCQRAPGAARVPDEPRAQGEEQRRDAATEPEHEPVLGQRQEGGHAEGHHQQHRQLQQRRGSLEQPRRPGVQPLQQAQRPSAAGGQRDLVDHVARQRVEVEEQLIRG